MKLIIQKNDYQIHGYSTYNSHTTNSINYDSNGISHYYMLNKSTYEGFSMLNDNMFIGLSLYILEFGKKYQYYL